MLVGGAPAAVFQHEAVVIEDQPMRLKLADPAAVKSHHFAGAFGNRQRDRKPVHLPGLRAQVGQTVANAEHAAAIEHNFATQAQPGVRVLADNG